MDTVPPAAPVEPVLVDGAWENANEGILGADNKSAVAVILELARRLTAAPASRRRSGSSCCSRSARRSSLRGSREFDVVAAAQRVRLRVRPRHADRRGRGRLAHPLPDRRRAARPGRARRGAAGGGPQRDRGRRAGHRRDAARPPGRRDDGQRGHDRGRHRDQRDPRALPDRGRGPQPRRRPGRRGGHRDDRPPRRTPPTPASATSTSTSSGCSPATAPSRRRRSWRSPSGRCGPAATSPGTIVSGGASDANSFEAAGFPCTNLADGTERNHEPTERISVDALESLLEIAIALVDEAASELAGSR